MIVFEESVAKPVEKQKVEIVERKGLGHPDYIADSLAEAFSKELVRNYKQDYEKIMHYNVDKLELVGGLSMAKFGGGEVKKHPIVFFSGRATQTKKGLERIATDSAKKWLEKNIRFLNSEKIRYVVETRPGSPNLTNLRQRKKISANDTSIGIGYAPLSRLEKSVLEIEKLANSRQFKKRFPFSGEDVKVMGIRKKDKMKFIMSMAFVDRFIKSEKHYFRKKERVRGFLVQKTNKNIILNCADKKGVGEKGCFLTVTGTSLEMGDDGAVGRGNRINGLIPFNRFFSMEAAAGKNIVNHVGKIYNILAQHCAEKIVNDFPEAGEVYVKILSKIGAPLDEPELVFVSLENQIKKDSVQKVLDKTMTQENISRIVKSHGPVF